MEGLSACECPVCFLLLNHTTHEPMSMPCGHTLCKVYQYYRLSLLLSYVYHSSATLLGFCLSFLPPSLCRCVWISWQAEPVSRQPEGGRRSGRLSSAPYVESGSMEMPSLSTSLSETSSLSWGGWMTRGELCTGMRCFTFYKVFLTRQ